MNFCFQRVVTSGSQARRMPPLNDEKKQEEALRREATELLAQHRAPRRRRGAHRPRSSCAATRQRCANIKSIYNYFRDYILTLLLSFVLFTFLRVQASGETGGDGGTAESKTGVFGDGSTSSVAITTDDWQGERDKSMAGAAIDLWSGHTTSGGSSRGGGR